VANAPALNWADCLRKAQRETLCVSAGSYVAKRAGTLAGIALVGELSKLAAEVVTLVEQSKLPLREQIARLVWDRCPDIKAGQSDEVAEAILAKAGEWCFPEWFLKEDMDTKLYQEFTFTLKGKFGNLGLIGKGKDFVERCIKLLKKARFTKPTEDTKP